MFNFEILIFTANFPILKRQQQHQIAANSNMTNHPHFYALKLQKAVIDFVPRLASVFLEKTIQNKFACISSFIARFWFYSLAFLKN